MSSPFFNPTEFLWTMPCSSAEGLRTGADPSIDSTLLCAPTGDLTIETTVTVALVQLSVPVGPPPQPQLSTYEARPQAIDVGGPVTIQRTGGRRNMNYKVRAVCADCKKGFGRVQELVRHKKDVHEQPRSCLFCLFKWTRPSNIKAHLFAKHSERFTAEKLVTIKALRGRMMVAFLDAYN